MRYADEDRADGRNTLTRAADEDFCTPEAHVTVVARHEGEPTLYGAECGCGWAADYLSTDPECAEHDGAKHEMEMLRG